MSVLWTIVAALAISSFALLVMLLVGAITIAICMDSSDTSEEEPRYIQEALEFPDEDTNIPPS